MLREQSDASAIERSLIEPASFDLVFERHYDVVHAFVSHAVGTDAAADLVQETFLTAFRSRRRFDRTRDSARPWLLGIARNVLRHWYRAESRRRRAFGRLAGTMSMADFSADADDRIVAAGAREQLRLALRRLPAGERDAFLLARLDLMTYAEIAAVMGTPIGTVRSRLSRARFRLRRALDGQVSGAGSHDVGHVTA